MAIAKETLMSRKGRGMGRLEDQVLVLLILREFDEEQQMERWATYRVDLDVLADVLGVTTPGKENDTFGIPPVQNGLEYSGREDLRDVLSMVRMICSWRGRLTSHPFLEWDPAAPLRTVREVLSHKTPCLAMGVRSLKDGERVSSRKRD
jgi:hypothetical protein